MSQNSILENQPGMKDLLEYAASTPGIYTDIKVGDLVKGQVISVSKNEVVIDIPNLGLGAVRGMELYNDEYLNSIKSGDEVEGLVLELENEKGMVEMSFRAIGRDQVWNELEDIRKNKKTVDSKVVHVNRGGLMVKVKGVIGFLPASLLSPSHSVKQSNISEANSMLKQMQKYIGQNFEVKIEDLDRDTDKLIVSERAVLEEAISAKLSKYRVGDIIEGRISGIVDFGLFIRFDSDLEGLIHISELAWKKVEDPRESFALGQLVKSKIISIDNDGRINLSIKQTIENPWNNFVEITKIGSSIEATVTKITSYGAICVTKEDIQGLCYVAQMSKDPIDPATKVSDLVEIGKKYTFTVIDINSKDCRLSLSMLNFEDARIKEEEIKAKKELKESVSDQPSTETQANSVSSESPDQKNQE
jgi:small subunit ribosomal protein S1